MERRAITLHTKEAMEPSDTRVSMLGAPWNSDVNPLMKNFWFMTMTIPASSICTMPRPIWLPSRKDGTGNPNIMCPMEKYMSTRRNPSDMKSLFLRTGVSLSLRASSFAAMTSEYEPLFFAGPPLRDAP